MVNVIEEHERKREAKHEYRAVVRSHSAEGREQHDDPRQSITAVVEELPQGRVGASPPGLLPVNGVQRLIDEKTRCTCDVTPGGE